MKKRVIVLFRLAMCLIFLPLPATVFALMGDVNNDQQISLSDTILSIRACILSIPPELQVSIQSDVNGDNRIGVAEALFGMEILSGLRHHPADMDDDDDGYSENQGDCDDTRENIFPGAAEICGDGIDQNCTDGDDACIPDSIYVEEVFTSEPVGFPMLYNFTVTGGRLWSAAGTEDKIYMTPWNGGAAPSGEWYAEPGDSNYFDDFFLSADTRWHGGLSVYPHGISFCQQKNSIGSYDMILFWITPDGTYEIRTVVDEGSVSLTGWKRSFLIDIHGGSNVLGVQKSGDTFRFFINGEEVERGLIPGFQGGAVGVAAFSRETVSFDDYTVSNPYKGDFVWFSEGYFKKSNELVHKVMTSTYLWYDRVPAVDLDDYAYPDVLLNDLIFKDLDKFSFITSQQQYYDLVNQGKYIGLGFGIEVNLSGEIVLSYVYGSTPAKDAGLKRGDEILEVNGRTIPDLFENNLWDTIWGEDEEGVMVELQVKNTAGEVLALSLEKQEVDINPVLHHEIIQNGERDIGYLVFNHFVETAAAELDAAFAEFMAAEIDDLVLDLRYNPGGLLYLAQYLSSLIAGENVGGEIFMNVNHNDKYQVWDATYGFEDPEISLDLNRLAVITQYGTCSASEQLINSLAPFIDVVTIGNTTCGKPVGMYGYDFLGLHISPVEFQNTNANGEGGYFSGMSATCPAGDDFTRQLGDPEEDSLKEALQYFITGDCSQEPAKKRTPESMGKEAEKRSVILNGFRREIGSF
jgi:carboxyl-terminal processing protease